MCGLIGAFKANGAHYKSIVAFMEQGLYISALRGAGGTGVGIVDQNFETMVAKSYVSSSVFIQTSEWEETAKRLMDARAVFGHTRYSTISGSTATKNSHPFLFSDENNSIMLTHNGHINNYHALSPTGFHHQVDSAHVAISMLKNGVKNTLEKLMGFYALVFWDAENETVNIAADGHREFSYVFSEDKKTIYYASEAVMLYMLMQRNGIKIHEKEGYKTIDPYTWHAWDLNKDTLADPVVEKYEEKKYAPVVSHYPRNNGGHNGSTSDYAYSPKKGDGIWCAVTAPDSEFQFYKKPEELDDPTQAFGYMWGTRRMDNALVKIQGISWEEWKTKWTHIKNGDLYLDVDDVDPKFQDGKSPFTKVLYTCHINRIRCGAEFINYENLKRNREQYAKNQRDNQDPTVRSLPGPTTTSGAVHAGSQPASVQPQNPAVGERGGDGLPELGDIAISPTYVAGPRGTRINLREWKEIMSWGCFFCSGENGKICLADVGNVGWYPMPRNHEDKEEDTEYQMICPVCVSDTQLMATLTA